MSTASGATAAPLLAAFSSAESGGIGAPALATLPLTAGWAVLHADGGASFLPSGPATRGCCGLRSSSRPWHAPASTLVGVEEVDGGGFRFVAARPVGRDLTSLGGRRRAVDKSPVLTPSSSPADSFMASVRSAVTRDGWALRPLAVLAVLNPASGPRRRASRVWQRTVAPLLAAAGIRSTAIVTTHPGHAASLAETASPSTYGALAGVGGDGTAAELVDGLMRRPDWKAAAAALPLSQIPAGSGNALAANAGTPGCAVAAAFALVKGVAAPLDVGVAVEGCTARRTHAFLSLSTGLVANADVGTDHLRCLGPIRFTLGAVWEALRRRAHPMDVWIVPPDEAPPEDTPAATPAKPGPPAPLVEALAASGALDEPLPPSSSSTPALPPLPSPWRHLPTAGGVSMLVACNLPLLDASTHMAPGAGRASGCLEVVSAPGGLSWGTALSLLVGVESGAHVKHCAVTCTPAVAVLIRPLDGGKSTSLALDGERVGRAGEAAACALECVPGAARVIVLK